MLFEEISTPEILSDIKRIFSNAPVVRTYGEANWNSLSLPARELVFDLRYRGDYTPRTRERLQRALVECDYDELVRAMNDTAYWLSLGVPIDRIRRRQALAETLRA